MKIHIKADIIHKYIWALKVLSLMKPPYNELRPREIEVLAYLLASFNQYSSIGEEEANSLVFSKKNKKDISNKLGISMDNLYNTLVNLRKLGFITDNKLNNPFNVGNEIIITFKQ